MRSRDDTPFDRPRWTRSTTSVDGLTVEGLLYVEYSGALDPRTQLQVDDQLEVIRRLLEASRPLDDDG